tara:strand:- start:3068 stop:3562 length:495 start_codon:yes stop_codon:yes gene_type:complete
LIDLVILGLAAFYLGRNFDSFDFDFSQNQDLPEDEPQGTEQAKFTEFMIQQQGRDRFGRTVVIMVRQYVQNGEVLFNQYQIKIDGKVYRSGYQNYDEAFEEYQKLIRPESPQEKARRERKEAQKAADDAAAAAAAAAEAEKERRRDNDPIPLTFDRKQQSGGVM